MLVPILSGDIQLEHLCDLLRDHGLAVLETTRTHAKQLFDQAIVCLDIDEETGDGPQLICLSAEVPDRGWSEFLAYSDSYEYIPGETQEIVVKAVQDWARAKCPDVHYASVKR